MAQSPGSRAPIRLALVNDHPLVVVGLEGMLAPYADRVRVVSMEAGGMPGPEAEIALLDTFGRPFVQDDSVAVLIREAQVKVVVFTWVLDPVAISTALAQGAAGYLSKGLSAERVVAAVEAVHAGRQVVLDEIPDPGAEESGSRSWPGQDVGLSSREAEVLVLITQGMTNQDIGDVLFLSVNTVKTYVRTLYRKIGAATRAQAVAYGFRHGFSPESPR